MEKLGTRRVEPSQFISPELARTLTQLVHDTRKPLALLINRAGRVEHVVVGAERRLYLPDIGRARASSSRLRGLRLIAAYPGSSLPHMPRDLITDLQRLQLDAVVSLGVDPAGFPGGLAWAHVLPVGEPGQPRHRMEVEQSFHGFHVDFLEHIKALEEELAREAVASRAALEGGASKDSAVLVGVYPQGRAEAEASMAELKELARAAGVAVVDVVMQFRRAVDPRTILGKGKLEDVVLGALQHGAQLIVFDRDLSPSQLNAVTQETELKVLDRTMLILDIFAQRARTTDGKLQVELAQLKYSLPRLAQRQSGMSRLSGGIGGRGPGETRLEIDKRRAKERVNRLEKELDRVARQRTLRRSQRREEGLPVISIVGYTNAGKSTLLNALTLSKVFVANQLFATLDPVSRRLRFPEEREVIITDTVGFIRDLPKDLVNAFQATLEELTEADLLLHVVDGNDPDAARHVKAVEKVLDGLGVRDTPRVLVLNKADTMGVEAIQERCNELKAMPISAATGQGVPVLLNACAQLLWEKDRTNTPEWVHLAPPRVEAEDDGYGAGMGRPDDAPSEEDDGGEFLDGDDSDSDAAG